MKHAFISGSGTADRLIVILAGWAMDYKPFQDLSRPGYDIAVVWNYSEQEPDWEFTHPYSEICLVAWSLGVAAAGITEPISDKITRRIAVAGTPIAVDDTAGIPRQIFEGTRRALGPAGLRKFYRRVCGSSSAFESFSAKAPERDIAELAQELDYFLSETAPSSLQLPWDIVIIPTEDAIYPVENQRRAWQGVCTHEIRAPHLPSFQDIIDRFIIDKELAGERFRRHHITYRENAAVQAGMVSELAAHIPLDGSHRFRSAFEPGSGEGALTRHLEKVCDNLLICDIAQAPAEIGENTCFRLADAELLAAGLSDGSFDLIASASVVQWFNSPRRFFEECFRLLHPGGIMAIATYCRGNLWEVSQCTGVELPLPDEHEWLSILPPRFKLLYCRHYTETLIFNNAEEVFRHLRLTGVTGVSRASSPARLREALRSYPRTEGKCTLTYSPLIFIVQK